jgi:MoxR-like ATPase
MRKHEKYDEVEKLIKHDIALLLQGEAGSGKTTLVKQVSDDAERDFYSISMTRQTTLGHLLGFISVNGKYIPSLLRKAFEEGGLMLIDEIDAGDPNVLLSLNTIENGYISFPDGLINKHKDFRLVATANPKDKHSTYTGRAKLDAATLDRFDKITVARDPELEKSLVDSDTLQRMSVLRTVLEKNNSSQVISMRDSIRFQVRKDLGLADTYVFDLVEENELIFEEYQNEIKNMPKRSNQSDCKTFEELVELSRIQSGMNPRAKPANDDDEHEVPRDSGT